MDPIIIHEITSVDLIAISYQLLCICYSYARCLKNSFMKILLVCERVNLTNTGKPQMNVY